MTTKSKTAAKLTLRTCRLFPSAVVSVGPLHCPGQFAAIHNCDPCNLKAEFPWVDCGLCGPFITAARGAVMGSSREKAQWAVGSGGHCRCVKNLSTAYKHGQIYEDVAHFGAPVHW